jgi:PilZ domain
MVFKQFTFKLAYALVQRCRNEWWNELEFSPLMNIDTRTIPRRERRFEIKMPVTVSGIAKDGHYFRQPAETLNGSTEGMGLLMDQELDPLAALVISISRNEQVLQIQSEVRHVTPFDKQRNLVGVKFRKMAFVWGWCARDYENRIIKNKVFPISLILPISLSVAVSIVVTLPCSGLTP